MCVGIFATAKATASPNPQLRSAAIIGMRADLINLVDVSNEPVSTAII